jgi:hypothetical protein
MFCLEALENWLLGQMLTDIPLTEREARRALVLSVVEVGEDLSI